MLEPVMVEVYGSKMPLNQVASVSAPEPRLLSVQVWDGSNAKAVEKAIRESGLNLNPQAEGSLIRVPIPALTEDRRKELVKVAGQYAEQARVSVRNVRRDSMETIKKMKAAGISEDEQKRLETDVQKMTDDVIGRIDKSLADKEKDIMTV
jgi:ribosome recycling factor